MNETSMLDDPLRTRLKCVESYIAGLRRIIPEEIEKHDIGFYSFDALEQPEAGIVHVCIVLKMDLEFLIERSLTGRYTDDHLKWLQILKGAVRTSAHLIDAIMEQYPDEFEHFGYGQPVRSEVQRTWSILQFAALELTKSIMNIEESYPQLSRFFANERSGYAQAYEHWGPSSKAEYETEVSTRTIQ